MTRTTYAQLSAAIISEIDIEVLIAMQTELTADLLNPKLGRLDGMMAYVASSNIRQEIESRAQKRHSHFADTERARRRRMERRFVRVTQHQVAT